MRLYKYCIVFQILYSICSVFLFDISLKLSCFEMYVGSLKCTLSLSICKHVRCGALYTRTDDSIDRLGLTIVTLSLRYVREH